jgi:hypothetical protein
MGAIREVVAVIVAADSPIGRVAQAVDDVAGHLPPRQEPQACPLCLSQSWPCARFDDAAHRVQTAGLRLGELVPLDLHPRLWPPPAAPPTPVASPAAPPPGSTPRPDTWFDEEHRDG